MKGGILKQWFGIAALIFLWACNVSVNQSVTVKDGATRIGTINTVNGNIVIGNHCVVKGSARAVNGRIEVGEKSRVQSLQTVNGPVSIGRDTQVDGDIGSVNGSITCDAGVSVLGKVAGINGVIELKRTTVERDVTTVLGNVSLLDHSVVNGDLVVKEAKGSSHKNRRLKIVLDDGSVVKGDVRVEDPDIQVQVYLSNGAKVEGRVIDAEVVESGN